MDEIKSSVNYKSSVLKVTGHQAGFTTEYVVFDNGAWRVLTDGEKALCDANHAEDVLREENALKLKDAKQYLLATDFKVLPDYDKDNADVKVKRQEARELIRSIEAE